MNYSCLRQTKQIRDISDPSGGAMYAQPATAAMPATIRIHAVRTADNQVTCPYTRKTADIADDRDWATVLPGEVRCDVCAEAIQAAA